MEGARVHSDGYGPALRAVGWYLDVEQSRSAAIREVDTEFEVHWQAPDGTAPTRILGSSALAAFQRMAREARGSVRNSVKGDYAELLRTLGQELDRRALSQVVIRESGGFRVSGLVNGSPTTAWYARDELQVLSTQRRAQRAHTAARTRPGWFPLWLGRRGKAG
jgi:hypothetical protein